jgi:hypothetical protein
LPQIVQLEKRESLGSGFSPFGEGIPLFKSNLSPRFNQ